MSAVRHFLNCHFCLLLKTSISNSDSLLCCKRLLLYSILFWLDTIMCMFDACMYPWSYIHDPIYILYTLQCLQNTVCFCKIMDEDDLQKEWQDRLFLGALFHGACNPPCCPPPRFIFALRPHTRTVRDVEPRTATSTFAKLLSSDDSSFNVALHPQRLYIHRDCTSTETVHPQRVY